MLVEHLLEFGLANRARALLKNLAAFEEQQSRDTANAIAEGGLLIRIHIQLTHLNFSGVFRGHLVDGRDPSCGRVRTTRPKNPPIRALPTPKTSLSKPASVNVSVSLCVSFNLSVDMCFSHLNLRLVDDPTLNYDSPHNNPARRRRKRWRN